MLLTVTALLAAALAYVRRVELRDWWNGVPVVRTWGDLLRQPAIRVGDSHSVRVGVEASSARVHSGVLLYCLFEGPRSYEFRHNRGQPFGPLTVEVAGSDDSNQFVRGIHQHSSTLAPPFLFLRVVPVTEAREQTIRISSEQREILKFVLHAEEHPSHPWIAFEPAETRITQGTQPGVVAAQVSGPTSSIALPGWGNGTIPFPRSATQAALQASRTHLPQLRNLSGADVPASGLELKVDGPDLLLTSSSRVEVSAAARRILARWWINGIPYYPSPEAAVLANHGLGFKPQQAQQLRLRVAIDRAALGVSGPETISLQLLYTSNPVTRLVSYADVELYLPSKPGVLVSQRVDFVVDELAPPETGDVLGDSGDADD